MNTHPPTVTRSDLDALTKQEVVALALRFQALYVSNHDRRDILTAQTEKLAIEIEQYKSTLAGLLAKMERTQP